MNPIKTYTLRDDQKITFPTNPKTTSGRDVITPPANFAADNPDTTVLGIAWTQGANPTVTIAPKTRFFGPDKAYNINIHATKSGQDGTLITNTIAVIVQGSLPDDGTTDHFEPGDADPVAQ